MRVVFLISCVGGVNSGVGGHYRSLLAIAHAIGLPYRIIVIGDLIPEAFRAETDVYLVPNQKKFLATTQKVHDVLGAAKILHAYDYSAAKVAISVSIRSNLPLVVTKAGGRPWSRAVLPFKHMIVFTKQDYELLQRHIFAPRELAMIPNRVTPKRQAHYYQKNVFNQCGDRVVKILCIARFQKANIYRFHAAFKLTNALKATGRNVHLTIVGAVQEQSILDEVSKEAGGGDVTVLTDPEYTADASICLGSADLVVASGRAVGEALECEKFIFFPVDGESLPCFLFSKTYDIAETYNFTARTPKGGCIDSLSSLRAFLSFSETDRLHHTRWSKKKFEERFSAGYGAERTLAFYQLVFKEENRLYALFRTFWDLGKVLFGPRRALKNSRRILRLMCNRGSFFGPE